MRNRLLSLLFCLLSSDAAIAAANYRYQALIDLDGDARSGCVASIDSGLPGGHELRLAATTDRVRVNEVALEVCRDGSWQFAAGDAAGQTIAAGQGIDGSDRVAWSVPRRWFGGHQRLSLHLLAERVDAVAADALALNTQWVPVELTLADEIRSIPTSGFVGLLLLTAMLGWFGVRRLRHDSARLWVWPLAAVALFGQGWLQHPARAADRWLNAAVAADPGNDVLDAGADILQARVSADAERIYFEFDVNDIEAAGLPDLAKVLFIGNSLTYSNDLPMMLEAIAAQAGKRLGADMIAQPNAALEDHFRARSAHGALANGGYEVVILQQGPSSLPESQVNLREWTERFAVRIRAGGARPALYMVWPDVTRSAYFGDVYSSYSNAALAVNGMFIPAGEAWRTAWRSDPALPLYDADQFHPSTLGSYAAALSMFSELYRQSPVGLPARLMLANGQLLDFDAGHARTVQIAAWSAHREHGRAGQ